MLDACRGRTNRKLLLEGKDSFLVKAYQHGLLFEKIDENGWPIEKRVGRHTSSLLQIAELWTAEHPDKGIIINHIPKYSEVIKNGVGAYLLNPAETSPERLEWE